VNAVARDEFSAMRPAALGAVTIGFGEDTAQITVRAMDVVQLWLRGSRSQAAVLWLATLAGAPAAAVAGAAAARSGRRRFLPPGRDHRRAGSARGRLVGDHQQRDRRRGDDHDHRQRQDDHCLGEDADR